MSKLEEERSFPDLVYPSLRDGGIKDGMQWLKGKALDDGAGNFWRIYDKLYDFTEFTKKHPGGEEWLALTKSTDITEAFESHHLSNYPAKLLDKFFVRNAETPRNSPFTFEEKGFYKVLKRRVKEVLKNVPSDCHKRSERLLMKLTLGTFAFSILSCYITNFLAKPLTIVLAGILLCFTTICAHNFLHKRDHWMRHISGICGMLSSDLRITHALSHHMYPNTIMDYEISSYEPIFEWLPKRNKTKLTRYAPWFYAFIVYLIVLPATLLKRWYKIISLSSSPVVEDLMVFTLPLAMFFFGRTSMENTIRTWLWIYNVGSIALGAISVNAAHHHPDIFHDGDDPAEDSDWGLHQLHAVMDRTDITGSHFRVLTFFGDHALHHLFPMLDHALLPYLYPVLYETCEEFKTRLRMTTQFELFIGQFKQMARIEPNRKKKTTKLI